MPGHHWSKWFGQDHIPENHSQEDSRAFGRGALGHESTDRLLRAAARRSGRPKRNHHGAATGRASTATAGELRSFLAKFLFTGDDVYKHVRDLSGGEKGRLALAKLIYSRVNVLVLDEPTNHLDIPSREALEEALDAYEGTIVTISHDRYFLDRVATQILALDTDEVADHYNGDYTEYHDWRAARIAQGLPLIEDKEFDVNNPREEVNVKHRERPNRRSKSRKKKRPPGPLLSR